MFPISTNQTRQLNIDNSQSTDWVFILIQARLKKLKVDNTTIKDNHIDFKNNMFFSGQGSWHLMTPVDNGYFDYNKLKSKMTYHFSTLTGFIFVSIFSCIVYFLSESWGGFFMFSWLYGMNWIIATIRHKAFFKELMDEIETENYNMTNKKDITTRQVGQDI